MADAETAQTDAASNRGAAVNAMRKRVRGLISELEGLIENDDSRWEGFGLNIPANPSAPESVASVAVASLGNGRIELSWPYATRAVRYRVEGKITGVDADFKNLGSFKDLGTILKGFTAGQTVQVRIVAGNEGEVCNLARASAARRWEKRVAIRETFVPLHPAAFAHPAGRRVVGITFP